MIEPSWTDADIALRRNPRIAVGMAVLQFTIMGIARVHFCSTQEGPVGGTGKTPLVAHPTTPGSAVAEDDGIGLPMVYNLVDAREIVVVTAVDGTAFTGTAIVSVAAIGTVEPDFEEAAVARQNLLELLIIIVYIGRSAVIRMVAVPRRQIQAQFKAVLVTGIADFLQEVDLSLCILRTVIGRICNVVFCQIARPHGETVMMFGHDNNALHAGIAESTHPLVHILTGGIEHFRVSIAIPPLTVAESIEAIMHKGIGLHLLPTNLIVLGKRGYGCRSILRTG